MIMLKLRSTYDERPFYQTSYERKVFTARCYASVVAMALCLSVCLSVRPSVRPSQVGVLLKRMKIGSHIQNHTIVQGFLVPKISAKFDRIHPLRAVVKVVMCSRGGSASEA